MSDRWRAARALGAARFEELEGLLEQEVQRPPEGYERVREHLERAGVDRGMMVQFFMVPGPMESGGITVMEALKSGDVVGALRAADRFAKDDGLVAD